MKKNSQTLKFPQTRRFPNSQIPRCRQQFFRNLGIWKSRIQFPDTENNLHYCTREARCVIQNTVNPIMWIVTKQQKLSYALKAPNWNAAQRLEISRYTCGFRGKKGSFGRPRFLGRPASQPTKEFDRLCGIDLASPERHPLKSRNTMVILARFWAFFSGIWIGSSKSREPENLGYSSQILNFFSLSESKNLELSEIRASEWGNLRVWESEVWKSRYLRICESGIIDN